MAASFISIVPRYSAVDVVSHAARAIGLQHIDTIAQHYHTYRRRDVEVTQVDMSQADMNDDIQKRIQAIIHSIPPQGLFIMLCTLIISLLVIISVRYTNTAIIASLAMVESPETAVIVSEEKQEKYGDESIAVIEQEVMVLKTKPVTSTIRATLRHIKGQGASPLHGASMLLLFGFAYASAKQLLLPIFELLEMHPLILDATISVLAHTICARLGLTWTHTLITRPSKKWFFQRIPSCAATRSIIGPVMIESAVWQLTVKLPTILAMAMELDSQTAFEEGNAHCTAMKLLVIGTSSLAAFLLLCVPTRVALRRISASLLPEEDQTMVNVDRTFNGAVVAKSAGGSGKLSFAQAWQTFNFGARVNLLKLYAKFLMIEVFLHLFLAIVLIAQFVTFTGMKSEEVHIAVAQ